MRSPPAIQPRRLLLAIGVIVVILLLFVLFVDMAAVGQQLRAAAPGPLLAASVCLVAGLMAYARRWRVLLDLRPPGPHTFHASNIGHAGNILIPARAGEALRLVAISRGEGVSLSQATASFVVERLFEQLMRLAALAAAVMAGVGLTLTITTVTGGVAVLVLATGTILWLVRHQEATLRRVPPWLARLPRITETGARASLADLLHGLQAVARPRPALRVLVWSLLSWVLFGAFFYLTLLALSSGFLPAQRLAVALGALSLSPPSAPTQPGIFHASLVVPLTAIGLPPAPLTAYAVLLHALEMVWMLGLAAWAVWQLGLAPRSLSGGA